MAIKSLGDFLVSLKLHQIKSSEVNSVYHTGASLLYIFQISDILKNFFYKILAKIAKIARMIKIEGFEFPENGIIILPHCAIHNIPSRFG